MPTKPTDDIINAAKVKLDPREVLEVVINETPALRDDLLKAGPVSYTHLDVYKRQGFDTGIRPWYSEKNELVWVSTWSNMVCEYERHKY